MSTTFRRYAPEQSLLLPPDVREWLPESHLAHHVSDLVDGLDLTAFYAGYEGDGRRNAPYEPRMLVKVLLYAYATGVFSSRRIARKLEEDVAFRVLAAGNFPQHRTICEFRRRHLDDFKQLFVEVVGLARELGLARFGKLSVDGTKVRANASKRKAMSYGRMQEEERRLSGEIDELLRAADDADLAEDLRLGVDVRGDELPAELRRWEDRVAAIRAAKARLEAAQRAADDARGRQPGQARNPKGGLRWSRFLGQPAKVYSRALGRHWDDDETAPPVHGGLQEAGGARGVAGGPNGAGDRGQARGPSEPGGHLEAAGGRGIGRGVRPRRIARPVGARGDDPRPAREDRRVDDGTGFFSAGVAAMSRPARRNLVDRDGALSIRRQCELMGISRSSVYYAPRGESAENLALMRRMDALSLQYPFYGSRQMARHLRREGVAAGRRRVRRLMGLIGLEAIYRKPRTSDAQPDHHVYPYLLRELKIDRPDQVWCADITYIPVTTGFLYLVAVMDWASRHVLSWRLSNTMDSSFCVEALEAALQTGTPGIFNTDQGSQFTSAAFTDRVQAAGARCSMDGRGRCLDNVFIERLWRSLKYEAVYLHELADGFVAEQVISEWMTFYSDVRPHSALGGRTPAEAYREEQAA